MKDKVLPLAALLLAMVSIQSGASIAKGLFPLLGSLGTTTLRLAFAALILVAIWRPWRFEWERSALLRIAPYGISLGAMNLFFYLSLERLPLGVAVALEFTGPLAVAIFASRRALDFVWAASAVGGVSLLLPLAASWGFDTGSAFASVPSSTDMVGVAYALAAGFFWACYIIFGQRAGASAPMGVVTSLGMVIACAVAVPSGVVAQGQNLIDVSLWPAALSVALLSSAIPYSAEMFALKRLPAKTFGILMSLEPAIAALLGMLILREKLSVAQFSAITSIVVASLGSVATMKRLQTST